MKIAVLFAGTSEERDVPIASVSAVAQSSYDRPLRVTESNYFGKTPRSDR